MSSIQLMIGDDRFEALLQDDLAPLTCTRFRTLLPWCQRLVHARWLGEGCWIPLRGLDLGVGHENPIRNPRPGQFIFYPGSKTESVILLVYGSISFSGHAGELAGNPFLTIVEGLDRLARIGREIARSGATSVTFGFR